MGVSPPWKTEYPEGCSTAMRRVVRKVATVEGRLVWFGGGFTVRTLFPDRWTCIWQDLRVGQWKEPCIRLTQENSIENSLQNCLPFILKAHGPCYVLLAYPKQPCIYFKANMHCACYMILFFEHLLHFSSCVTWLTLTLSSINRKISKINQK